MMCRQVSEQPPPEWNTVRHIGSEGVGDRSELVVVYTRSPSEIKKHKRCEMFVAKGPTRKTCQAAAPQPRAYKVVTGVAFFAHCKVMPAAQVVTEPLPGLPVAPGR